MYISPYCRLVLVPPNFMKFGIRGQFTDIIMCVKLLVDRFRGYGVLTPPKLPFPIDLLRRPYNSVRTTVRHCDTWLLIVVCSIRSSCRSGWFQRWKSMLRPVHVQSSILCPLPGKSPRCSTPSPTTKYVNDLPLLGSIAITVKIKRTAVMTDRVTDRHTDMIHIICTNI